MLFRSHNDYDDLNSDVFNNTSNYKYKCDKCERTYDYISLLKKHQNNKRSCIKNEDYLDKINNLTTKIETLYNNSIVTDRTCIFCKKDFLNKGNLSKHLRNNCDTIKELQIKKNNIIEQQNKFIEENKLIQQQKEINKLRNDLKKMQSELNKNKN